MYLNVAFDCSSHGIAVYAIRPRTAPSRRTKNGHSPKKDRDCLSSQASRIEEMAKKMLKGRFLGIECSYTGNLLLQVKTGTSTKVPDRLRNLFDWISVCTKSERKQEKDKSDDVPNYDWFVITWHRNLLCLPD